MGCRKVKALWRVKRTALYSRFRAVKMRRWRADVKGMEMIVKKSFYVEQALSQLCVMMRMVQEAGKDRQCPMGSGNRVPRRVLKSKGADRKGGTADATRLRLSLLLESDVESRVWRESDALTMMVRESRWETLGRIVACY